MFITLEGPEGSGKTTQMVGLAEFLLELGYPVVTTREPGGTSIGDQIREVLSAMENTEMKPRTEILLFQASRSQLVEQVIKPNLEEGNIVLCDRYADSTLAYQGYGHGVDIEKLTSIIDFATGGLKPDLTLLLDLEVEEGLLRRSRGGEWNRLDAYNIEFHQRVREGYLRLVSEEPMRWVIIDADRESKEVQESLRNAVQQVLKDPPDSHREKD